MLWALPAEAQSEQVLYEFSGTTDGYLPYGGLQSDKPGNLYGTTIEGGDLADCSGLGCGAVFELTHGPSGWQENILYAFGAKGGSYPYGVTVNSTGTTMYGTTQLTNNGNGYGTVFRLRKTKLGWARGTLHRFTGKADGRWPTARPVVDSIGNLYGVAQEGGETCGCGTVFEISRSTTGGWLFTVLHSFSNGADGRNPTSPLTLHNGALYGTTASSVFSLTPGASGSWIFNVLSPPGVGAGSDVIFDSTGNLYAVSSNGGAYGYGSVFELTPTSSGPWTLTTLYSFQGTTDGAYPEAALLLDATGNLFGTTTWGGSLGCSAHGSIGCGTVFKLTSNAAGGWTETVIHSFTGLEGAFPNSPLIQDSFGNLYGETYYGGSADAGVIFEITQ
jgi:uncharacterized repeat protein (TIGR03803 family)